jgi:pSer/pThr/pTyr-binding forkhead associated (FHA) protein/ribosomal protein L40E
MDLFLGIVCGQCSALSPLRASTCARCDTSLELFPGLIPAGESGALLAASTELSPTSLPPASPIAAFAVVESAKPPPVESTPSGKATTAPDFRRTASLQQTQPESGGARGGFHPTRDRTPKPLLSHTSSTDLPAAEVPLTGTPLVDAHGVRRATGTQTASIRPSGSMPAASGSPMRVSTDVDLRTALTESLRPRRSPFPRAREDRGSPAPHRQRGSTPGLQGTTGYSLEELMEQAKNFVCRSCSTSVPLGHKFCGRCGAVVPPEILETRTKYFGHLQTPGKAKLILIRGEGIEGLSYQLNAETHSLGRTGQLVFPDDAYVSPKHANLFYRDGKLVVRDEGSLNGVYLRVRGGVTLKSGDYFLAGDQVFQVEVTPTQTDAPAPDGTHFYSSPKHQTPFRITQMLAGGARGMTICARPQGIQIGREGGDLNFPTDLYLSATHCKIEDSGGVITLSDLNSRNGTFVRLAAERELSHGDYLFIGKKLLRVEINAA